VAVHLAEQDAELRALRQERTAGMESLTAPLESLTADLDDLGTVHATVAAERDRSAADVEGAQAAQTRLEETIQQTLEQSRAREEEVAARLTEREHELESLRTEHAAEVAALNAQLEALAAESGRVEVEQTLPPADEPAPAAELEVSKLPTATEPPPEATAPAKPRPAARPAKPSAPPPALEEGRKVIAVLDGVASWEAVKPNGYDVVLLAPDGDVVAGLAQARPGRLVVNLAAPGALQALVKLRAKGAAMRFWGCIADGAGGRALPLGMVEPACRPLDPDAVLASLSAYSTRGTRVVTLGADVEALVSLRQALARQGLSVSMAWDAKQAAELLAMVRPEVVIVDMEIKRDACTVVARLAENETVPPAVLIEGTADAATAFAATLSDPALGSKIMNLDRALKALLTRKETAPERR
jgi:hypothetical protein